MPDEPSPLKRRAIKAVAGGGTTALIIWIYATFALKSELDRTRVELQATRDILMVLKGSLRLESKYE